MAFRDPCKVISCLPADFSTSPAKVRGRASRPAAAAVAALILAVIAGAIATASALS